MSAVSSAALPPFFPARGYLDISSPAEIRGIERLVLGLGYGFEPHSAAFLGIVIDQKQLERAILMDQAVRAHVRGVQLPHIAVDDPHANVVLPGDIVNIIPSSGELRLLTMLSPQDWVFRVLMAL